MSYADQLAAAFRRAPGSSPDLRQSSRKLRLSFRQSSMAKLTRHIHRRQSEGLRLYLPLPHLAEAHGCRCKWRVIDGSNRSGKTQWCAAECARAALGCDPFGKYVPTGGNALIVGKEEDDLVRLWETLSEPCFKKIRDEQTRAWRAVRPDPNDPLRLDPYDEAYREKWQDAAPLIPKRYLASEPAWSDKRKGAPRLVKFTNGWSIMFRSSNGKAPQGGHYHFGWIDEQLLDEEFFREMNRGLVGLLEKSEHLPKGVWSATAQVANLQLTELRHAAEQGAAHAKAFLATVDQNPFVPPGEKKAFHDSLTVEEREYRYFGKHAVEMKRVYAIYDPQGIHGCEPFAIPPAWCVYVVLDPGRDHCGCLFAAVDPEGQHVWIFDGFDLRQSGASRWAGEVARRQGEMRFEAFLIDSRAGQQHQMGDEDDESVAEKYWNALKAVGVQPRQAGPLHGFFAGTPNVEAREEAVLSWMEIRGHGPFAGTPRLQIFRGMLPQLDQQIRSAMTDPNRNNKRKKGKGVVEDLVVCLEYLAGYDPQYHAPKPVREPETLSAYELLQRKRQRQASNSPFSVL